MQLNELSKAYHVDGRNLERYLSTFKHDIINISETKHIIDHQGTLSKRKPIYTPKQLVTKEFIEMLSDDDVDELNEQEAIYCFMMAKTGDNQDSLEASGLDKGLMSGTKAGNRESVKLRGIYLRTRPKIITAIEQAQDVIRDQIAEGKGYIQTKLIHNIEQMQEIVADHPGQRTSLLRAIELLGRTIPNTFDHKLTIETVDASTALDKLIEMAKSANDEEVDDEWEAIKLED